VRRFNRITVISFFILVLYFNIESISSLGAADSHIPSLIPSITSEATAFSIASVTAICMGSFVVYPVSTSNSL
jgi:hypothetical protein